MTPRNRLKTDRIVLMRRYTGANPMPGNGPWFELLGHKLGLQIVVDFTQLKLIQDAGHTIMDLDALRADAARNN